MGEEGHPHRGSGGTDGSAPAGVTSSQVGTEMSLTAFRLPMGSLVEYAERYVADGSVPPAIAAAIHGPCVDEVLRSVHEPVLRLSLVGRRGKDVEQIGGWVGPTFSVLALGAASPPTVASSQADSSERAAPSTGEDDIVPVATEHLPLHLAVLMDLGPRQRNHGVHQPLQVPASSLEQVLPDDAEGPPPELPPQLPPELPPELPRAWAQVLRSWAVSPPRTMSLTVGQSRGPERRGEPPNDGDREGAGRDAPPHGGAGQTKETTLWRSFTVLHDPDRGLWLVDDEMPVPPDRTSVVVAPTDPTALLDLIATALRPHP